MAADSGGALDGGSDPAAVELEASSSTDAVADEAGEGAAADPGPERSPSAAVVAGWSLVASFERGVAVERGVLSAGGGSHGLVPVDEDRVLGRGGARKGVGLGAGSGSAVAGAEGVAVAVSLGEPFVCSSVSTSHSSSLGHPAGDEPDDASEGGRGAPPLPRRSTVSLGGTVDGDEEASVPAASGVDPAGSAELAPCAPWGGRGVLGFAPILGGGGTGREGGGAIGPRELISLVQQDL